MDRRVVAGGVVTAVVVATVAAADFVVEADLVVGVILAGACGGFVAGVLSDASGHVGAGARGGAYGGAAAFGLFVVVGLTQSVVAGDDVRLPALVGFELLLIAVLVVPIHGLLGAVGAAVGVRVRRRLGADASDGDEPTT